MHDPIGLVAIGSPALVVHQRLPHAHQLPLLVSIDRLVSAGGLPKPSGGGTVGPGARRVFLVFVAEEVPLVLLLLTRSSQSALLCMPIVNNGDEMGKTGKIMSEDQKEKHLYIHVYQ